MRCSNTYARAPFQKLQRITTMEPRMPAYFIAEIVEVLDQKTYSEYVNQVRGLVESCGGRYLVRGGAVTPVAGGWTPGRLIIIEFKNADAIRTCFRSEAYQAIAGLRESSTRSRSVIVEGC